MKTSRQKDTVHLQIGDLVSFKCITFFSVWDGLLGVTILGPMRMMSEAKVGDVLR